MEWWQVRSLCLSCQHTTPCRVLVFPASTLILNSVGPTAEDLYLRSVAPKQGNMKGRWWWENLGWLKAVSGFGLPMSEAVGWSGGWGR